jgi:uncharacterized protein (DUF608 family)
MIDLIKASKAIDYFAILVFVCFAFILWYYFKVDKASDYIALMAIYTAIYLQILSVRSNDTKFKAIQENEIARDKVANDRYLLGQRMRLIDLIASLRTQSDTNCFKLKYLLSRHGGKMEDEQREALENTVNRITEEEAQFEGFFDSYNDLSNEFDIDRVNQDIAYITTALAEANTTSQMIEDGFKSYE